jgi:23S rRNA (guanosine2251-2'-O)-methyltransferase
LDKDNFIIYGKQPVYELLRSSHPISQLVCAYELDAHFKNKIKSLAEKRKIEIDYVAKAKIQKYCGTVVHQGIVAKIVEYNYISNNTIDELIKTNKSPVFIILDQIQDPHNLGAIIRTAEIIGATAFILPGKGSAEINSTVAKTSSGAIFHCSIYRTNRLFEFLEMLKENQINIIALMPGQPKNIYNTDLTVPLALIFGSEGIGIRKNIQKYCDLKISIPQVGRINSLNVSVTAAVVLFELFRQRRYKR